MKIFIGALILLSSCKEDNTLFSELSPRTTGIHFSNRINENDSVNILDNEYVYNGGGVGIADFNQDGLPDVYFTGNMAGNKMYLNQGNFRFSDITDISQTGGDDRWCSGTAIADINGDGLPDIYVCATFTNSPGPRTNLLYINQGNNKEGIPVFREMAAAYGLADTSYSTNAVFFDYDRDGDLDVYLLVDKVDPEGLPNKYHYKIRDGSSEGTDKLFRNDPDTSLNHPVFTNVSREAGINIEGFGLGVHVTDINRDGWPDIYVTNDFISNDLLYVNNRNGTFTNRAGEYFKHTSFSAMGNDIADINNDGKMDIIALDMLPEDNFRKKMMLSPNNYSSYINTREYQYEYQYVRNTLQLNMGEVTGPDSLRKPLFSDIAYYSNIAATDWSWAPLVADFDNDGFRDLIITNGFPRDVTDHDFIAYRANTKNYAPKDLLLEQIPSVKLKNYAYRNNGDLTFSDETAAWGITKTSFSNGAAYADLDNDGDLDYIVNNINDSASVFRNNLDKSGSHHYLRVSLTGDGQNRQALGAVISLFYGDDKIQVHENTPYRGYLSSMESIVHFGLGTDTLVRKISITWPDGQVQTLHNVRTDQVLTVEKKADSSPAETDTAVDQHLFRDITSGTGISYRQEERDYIDFNVQVLLPHKFSQYGPALAVGDVNGDGLDDFFVGGSYGHSGSFFLQKKDGSFEAKELEPGADMHTKKQEDAGVLLFDADLDGDLDLYIAGGGFENPFGSANYHDRFYVNTGDGFFREDSVAIPASTVSKSCVKAADFDHDGDLDLFVGGRVIPEKYPMPAPSYILRNESTKGNPRFVDVTGEVAPDLAEAGLICDMLWSDFDNDGWPDMVLAGEWMPIMIMKNQMGRFMNITDSTGIRSSTGWWNSLVGGDFDNDGDIDYLAGNAGLNSFYKASPEHPARIYAGDYNHDGGFDAIPSLYLPDKKGRLQEFPAFGRDDMIKQMIGFKARYTNYNGYAIAPLHEVLTEDEIKNSLILEANTFSSSYLENKGGGKFEIRPLPVQAQMSSVFAMIADDVDDDGNLDVIINGNDFGIEISTGRYDAFHGLVLKGDGAGHFKVLQPGETGYLVPGDGKSLVRLLSASGEPLLIAGQNNGPLLVFEDVHSKKTIRPTPGDVSVYLTDKNNRTRKVEIYHGNSFYSQSGRYITAGSQIKSIRIVDQKGHERVVNF